MRDKASGRGRLLARKSLATLQREAGQQGLKRSLGPLNLVLLGIGCILGAGIYVMPGNAAAFFAGPAVMLSFVVCKVSSPILLMNWYVTWSCIIRMFFLLFISYLVFMSRRSIILLTGASIWF